MEWNCFLTARSKDRFGSLRRCKRKLCPRERFADIPYSSKINKNFIVDSKKVTTTFFSLLPEDRSNSAKRKDVFQC